MVVYVHPVADEATDRWLVYDTCSTWVAFTEPLRVLLEVAATDRPRPILVTSPDARLSPFAAAALGEAGGAWVVRADDGPFDAVTGQPLASFDDLWNRPDRLHPTFQAIPPPAHTIITYDVYTGLRADPETQTGRTAQTMTRALGGAGLDWWGTTEPLLDPWDADRIATFAKASMPRTPALLLSGTGAQYARLWAGRARHGLVERAAGGVPVGTSSTLSDLVAVASDALVTVNDQATVLVGIAWAGARTAQAATAPGARPADQPLAVLIGPRAVRDLGADLAAVSEHHDTQVLGRARTPSLLVRFNASEADRWPELLDLVQTLGPQAVARAVGRSPDAR